MASKRLINLYSDTQTQPTDAMRSAMANAPVGDEQRGEDPSVNALCERVALMLGKERAVFLPSGTMCNELAIRVHCRPGDEVIAEASSHIIHFEGGGPAALSGVMIASVLGKRGVYDAAGARAAIRTPNRYAPVSRLVAVEQTANMAGGTVWPVSALREVSAVAKEHGLATHMDGARLPNAVIASGQTFAEHAEGFDTVWIDLSKGLGCPVGAVLAASEELIDEIWRWKQRVGGAMRQAGILAAAGLYALDHHLERLVVDHTNARRLAAGIANIGALKTEPDQVDSNILFFEIDSTKSGINSAEALCDSLKSRGIIMGAMGQQRVRAVTHLDISEADIDVTVAALDELVTR
ncbi:MAG: threonine aldolase [Gammaproteobacteria bacterium]|jgi:threonine aldolase